MTEISDSRVRDLAHQILARPEYDAVHPTRLQSWLWSLLEKLLNLLVWLATLRGTAPGLYWLIMAALVMILILMVAQIAWSISAALKPTEAVPEEFPTNLRNPAAEAERQAASGDFLGASHNIMIATFSTLAQRSVIELRPDRSNRWIRLALRESSLSNDLASEIDELVAQTERHWFGDRANSSEIYRRWKSALELVSFAVQ